MARTRINPNWYGLQSAWTGDLTGMAIAQVSKFPNAHKKRGRAQGSYIREGQCPKLGVCWELDGKPPKGVELVAINRLELTGRDRLEAALRKVGLEWNDALRLPANLSFNDVATWAAIDQISNLLVSSGGKNIDEENQCLLSSLPPSPHPSQQVYLLERSS